MTEWLVVILSFVISFSSSEIFGNVHIPLLNLGLVCWEVVILHFRNTLYARSFFCTRAVKGFSNHKVCISTEQNENIYNIWSNRGCTWTMLVVSIEEGENKNDFARHSRRICFVVTPLPDSTAIFPAVCDPEKGSFLYYFAGGLKAFQSFLPRSWIPIIPKVKFAGNWEIFPLDNSKSRHIFLTIGSNDTLTCAIIWCNVIASIF